MAEKLGKLIGITNIACPFYGDGTRVAIVKGYESGATRTLCPKYDPKTIGRCLVIREEGKEVGCGPCIYDSEK